jgi:serine/threonine-protein kinase
MLDSCQTQNVQLGAYKLADRIGGGRLAQVYRATDASGQSVAIKLLAPEAEMDDPSAHQRFEREIHMLAGIDHPNVIRLLGHGIDDELGPYLVTPLVEGETLRALMSRGPVIPEIALLAVHQIARGIQAMHAAGVLHRDLKPENVMVRSDGSIVIIDLGLAFRPEHTRYTEEGAVAGSLPYMAPEQIDDGGLSFATDVWALGVMLHEWISGKRPFERPRHSEEVAAILSGRFPPLADTNRCVSADLGGLADACLQIDPMLRPHDAGVFAAALETQFDWFPPAWAARHARDALSGTAFYSQGVAAQRKLGLAKDARRELERAEVFAATHILDRALAYAPDDPDLLALAQETTRAPAAAKQTRRTTWPYVIAALALLSTAIMGAWMLTRSADRTAAVDEETEPDTPSADTSVVSDDTPAKPTKGLRGALPTDPSAPLSAYNLGNDDDILGDALQSLLPGIGDKIVERDQVDGNAISVVTRYRTEKDRAILAADPATHVNYATALMASYNEHQGLEEIALLVGKYPDRTDVQLLAAQVAIGQGKWDLGDLHLTNAIELAPKLGPALRDRGILRHRRGKTRDGFEDLMAALDVTPNDIEIIRELAALYRNVGRAPGALGMIERALELAPEDANLWIDVGLAREGDAQIAALRKAIELDAESKRAHNALCMSLDRQTGDGAIEACETAMAYDYDNIDVMVAAGRANLRAGDARGAQSAFLRAQGQDQSDPRAAAGMAEVFERLGYHESMVEGEWRKACRLGDQPACDKIVHVP